MLKSSYFSKSHLSVNCPVGELACRRTVLSVNCLIGELAVGELGVGEQSATRR